jgi:two-component system, NtrC family, nitrogen regulation response regulator NtrX
MPGIDGLDTLQKIRALENPPEVIMISGHGTIETAVRATKLGAYDFLEKPLSIERTLSWSRTPSNPRSCAAKTST